ncbi:MAG: efflux RND transporter periplasmic adaptor subunit [Prevotellaceae bacterium]|jgi:HlyD family secretion protein|nr:efflux RND transporter periplasmic adaptor subunit [Prevotellaceae bacterium]
MKKRILIFSAVVVIVLVATGMLFMGSSKHNFVFNTAMAKTDSIQIFVTATGYVQPVTKVDVGTQVSGVIEKIYVDFNSQITKGQLLAELDKSTLSEKLSQARASYSTAESDLAFAQQNYDRIKQLYNAKAATLASLEDATNKLTVAKNTVTRSKADVQQAQVNLSYAEIYSPISGVVLNRAVDEGQTVAASFNTPTLFTIANDLTKMQVEADVDEADIGGVKDGQQVSFTVDSYPDDVFTGTVQQIRLQPTVTSNVVTYVVIIEAPNPEEKLYPGMTASVSIITNDIKGLTVPVEALHFTPDNEALKQMNAKAEPSVNRSDKHVWIKDIEGYHRQKLTIGINDGVNVIVSDGLQEGEIVVLSVHQVTSKSDGKAVSILPQGPRGGGRR